MTHLHAPIVSTRTPRGSVAVAALIASAALFSAPAHAHGVIGKRFFPATLATDDPFVADELSLPTYDRRKLPGSGDEPATTESGLSVDFSKRITQDFGLGIGASYRQIETDGADKQRGWDNFAVSAKYQVWKSEPREALVSVGVDWDIGGTGTKRIGAESFSTITPALLFGKGFGDLPESARYLRPFAFTGQLGIAVPTRGSTSAINDQGEEIVEQHPTTLRWGGSLQYSIPYLQSNVADAGWREPFSRLIPVVEFDLETPLNRGRGGTTGTINPGLLWAGRYVQLGIEAVIPVNNRSGSHTGVIAQLHFFLDDLFPASLGRPLIGR